MDKKGVRFVALVAALAALATLPVAAAGSSETVSSAASVVASVEPSPALASYFADRGVDPQYLGKTRSEVPADQWSLINEIVAIENVEDSDTDTLDYDDAHDVLNSLVFETLYAATDEVGVPVHLRLGDATWTHELTEDDDSDTDIYGFPVSGIYPTPRG